MHKLRRFFYQNKYQIFKVLGIIAFIIIIIQLMNLWARKSNNKKVTNVASNTTTVSENNHGLVSTKSAVTGNEISKEELNGATTAINNFVDYCNKQDFERAYDLITDECKKQLFKNVNEFKTTYYQNIFNGEKKNCTIENWVKNTYRVNFTGDILATGKDDGTVQQDYITVKEVDDGYKLNINNYIGYADINKKTTKDGITIEVVGRNTYKDYEEYTIKATNKTESLMQLDDVNSTNTLYIEDSKGVKYTYYNHELATPMITIQSGQTKEVNIKFYSSYVSTKTIKRMVFSDIILKNGQLGEIAKMDVNI